MDHCPEQATVVYRSKDGKEKKTYLPAATAEQAGDALEWPTAMACHVPERGKRSIRYYARYATSVRAKRAQAAIPTVLECSLPRRSELGAAYPEGLRSLTLGLSPMQKGNASRSGD
jgi:hypothetical protein